MLYRLILKVTKFQLPTPKSFSTADKISVFFFLGGYHALPHVKYGKPYLDWEGEGGGGKMATFESFC